MKLIASLLIFYPLVVPLWQKGPILQQNSTLKKHLSFITTPDLKFQVEKFKELKDSRIKSRMLFEWSRSNNPDVVPMFFSLLKEAESDNMKSDIIINLFKMRHIKKCGGVANFAEMMSSENETIRAYSIALYLDNNGKCDDVLRLLEKEKSPFVLSIVRPLLKEHADLCSTVLLKKLLKSERSAIRAVVADVLVKQKNDPDNFPELMSVCEDKDVLVRSALAEGLSKRLSGGKKMLTTLSHDSFSTVRSFVASATPRNELLSIYITLASDPSWEVRRIVALSLGGIKTDSSISTLIKMLSDPVSEVRDAAESAIIRIKPSQSVLKKIGEQCMSVKLSRPYAITILGKLNDQRFAPQITSYLKSTSDDNIILRAVTALDNLDYKSAEELVRKQKAHSDYKIRCAVAHALGTFAKRESFDTLLELSIVKKDKKTKSYSSGAIPVITEAITSMGRIADPYFNKRLTDILYDVNNASSEMRSTACWSIARINKPESRSLKQLEKIILKEIIPVEGGKCFDSDVARISALLALVDMGKKDSKINVMVSEALKKLNPPPGTLSFIDMSSPSLKEWARQVSLYMQGNRNIKPAPIPAGSVSLTVNRCNRNSR